MRLLLVPILAGCAIAAPALATDPAPPPLVAAGNVTAAVEGDAAASEAAFAPPPATLQQQIAQLTNYERAICTSGCPLPPLKLVPLLLSVGNGHSHSMAIHDFFSHYDPTDGCSSPGERLSAAGYAYSNWAENVAAGHATAAATMAQWMGSAGHRANILHPGMREIGVGFEGQPQDQANIDLILNSDCDCTDTSMGETCSGGPWYYYWTQVFGVRNSVYPLVIAREAHLTATGNVELHVYGPGTAIEMRFSNDGLNWSAWEPYDATTSHSLAAGDGLRTVYSQVRNSTTVYSGCDTIWRTGAGGDELFANGFDCEGWSAWSDVSLQ